MHSESIESRQPSPSGLSPFRYPGGKAWLTESLASELQRIAPLGGTYLEPYAGGAGAAIRLLRSGAAVDVYLNDADPRVFAAWYSLLRENDRFQERLAIITPSIEEWWKCKRIVDDPSLAADTFELGFATFFLNRTNRSGILQGAAPIGGYHQKGDWTLDVRFYRETMLARIKWLGEHASHIFISQQDGLSFLKSMAATVDPGSSLFFVDPPYVTAGSRLYMNGMTTEDHRALAQFLCQGVIPNWIVTYDDDPLVREIYRNADIERKSVRYTLQKKRTEHEVIIKPKHIH
jgi:DNA adenine methylase